MIEDLVWLTLGFVMFEGQLSITIGLWLFAECALDAVRFIKPAFAESPAQG